MTFISSSSQACRATVHSRHPKSADGGLEAAIREAMSRIAPLWPLKHFVAVNPFAGIADLPFHEACELMGRSTGAMPLQSPQDYLAAWRSGVIGEADLAPALSRGWSIARLVRLLEEAETVVPQVTATVADLLDQERPNAHWVSFVTEEISKWCAVTFDCNQTTWNSPWKREPLFAGWRQAAVLDRNPEVFGLRGFRSFVAGLPDDATEVIGLCMRELAPAHACAADFLHRQLCTIAGWAGHVKYRVREDELRGLANPALRDLLAIRLAYDTALFRAFGEDRVFRANWRHLRPAAEESGWVEGLSCWQDAYEAGFRRKLAAALVAQPLRQPVSRPGFQAVFCIDVRSEVIRRHLESSAPGAQTIGFAGFFGFPVAHRSETVGEASAHCPALIVPPVASRVQLAPHEEDRFEASMRAAAAWKAFQNSAASCFSFVEAVGLAFAGALARLQDDGCCNSGSRAPVFADEVSLQTRAAMAAGALRNMGLTSGFARLVLFCGHGGRSANNPYASALDCGACGGHAGDVNARLAVATLNDPAVRVILAGQGIAIPDDTRFIAGMHRTSTDEVALYDEEAVPAGHAADLAALKRALAAAAAATRAERAPLLELGEVPADDLTDALEERSRDISQVRPEWGLANNAAIVVAPRARTAGLKLDGRVFLHDYDPAADPDRAVLSLILSAPVVVASWINLQYYASRTNPRQHGGGDKALHNVAAGLGVFEGNGGDLRTGLPLQSVHDGSRFVHEPRRLAVFIEAAPDDIDAVLAAHPDVSRLFDNGWIHLHALVEDSCHHRTHAGWVPVGTA